MSVAPKFTLAPCRCGAWRFPHRRSRACVDFARWLSDDHYASEKADAKALAKAGDR